MANDPTLAEIGARVANTSWRTYLVDMGGEGRARCASTIFPYRDAVAPIGRSHPKHPTFFVGIRRHVTMILVIIDVHVTLPTAALFLIFLILR